MSSPARLERPELTETGAPYRSSVATELLTITTELDAGLRFEQANLCRDVLLWQRWVRYLAIGTMVLLALLFGAISQSALLPLALVAGAYVGVVLLTTWMLRRPSTNAPGAWLPALVLTADGLTVAGFFYLTTAPQELPRVLILGVLSTWLGVFYFGPRHGALAAALAIAGYVALARIVPPFVVGAPESSLAVAFNATLFAVVSAAVVYTFASFRERLDAMRMYCKVVERGDTSALPPLPSDQWPDGLTLLARSFQSMHARLAEQVGSDALTGCLNRRSLETRLRADLRSARRRGSTVAVAAVDLDHFKEINDTRGHPVGDIVLQQVANIMKTTARDTDAVARYGGDEFVVILPDTGWQGALTFADRLRRRVDDFSFGPPNTPPMGVTISVGVALGRGSDALSTEGLIQEADAALYRAKTAGRNRVFS